MTNEELKSAIAQWDTKHTTYLRAIKSFIESARELLQLKDGTHPDMVMVKRAELDLRYEQGRRDELNKLALAAAPNLKESNYCPHCGFYCHGKSPLCTKGKTK